MSKAPLSSMHMPPVDDGEVETAVPTLRVMRLQSPELHQSVPGSLDGHLLLEGSLCLPDSLTVHVGETFFAYLGILNTSAHWPIRRLTVSSQLQTPSQRWQLSSRLDTGSLSGGITITPQSGVDTIVSHAIEEAGQHILRVEVGYMTGNGGSKTFRKFYRFHVTAPLTIQQCVVRSGDNCCFVSVDVECNSTKSPPDGPLLLCDASFIPVDGLSAERIGDNIVDESPRSALELYDSAGITQPGGSVRYLFRIVSSSKEAILRGISAGDLLGRASVRWRKAMGETGQCMSSPVHCPSIEPSFMNGAADHLLSGTSNFVVHRSGLSVDVASVGARRNPERDSLLAKLPVTIEPINPPSRMRLNVPQEVQFLVVNQTNL
jgi:trafficking protein particle complex subunit 13